MFSSDNAPSEPNVADVQHSDGEQPRHLQTQPAKNKGRSACQTIVRTHRSVDALANNLHDPHTNPASGLGAAAASKRGRPADDWLDKRVKKARKQSHTVVHSTAAPKAAPALPRLPHAGDSQAVLSHATRSPHQQPAADMDAAASQQTLDASPVMQQRRRPSQADMGQQPSPQHPHQREHVPPAKHLPAAESLGTGAATDAEPASPAALSAALPAGTALAGSPAAGSHLLPSLHASWFSAPQPTAAAQPVAPVAAQAEASGGQLQQPGLEDELWETFRKASGAAVQPPDGEQAAAAHSTGTQASQQATPQQPAVAASLLGQQQQTPHANDAAAGAHSRAAHLDAPGPTGDLQASAQQQPGSADPDLVMEQAAARSDLSEGEILEEGELPEEEGEVEGQQQQQQQAAGPVPGDKRRAKRGGKRERKRQQRQQQRAAEGAAGGRSEAEEQQEDVDSDPLGKMLQVSKGRHAGVSLRAVGALQGHQLRVLCGCL